jgi:hypothetical protein
MITSTMRRVELENQTKISHSMTFAMFSSVLASSGALEKEVIGFTTKKE